MAKEQSILLAQYNDNYREKFNQELFVRSEDAIIDKLKMLILSSQREQPRLTFKVNYFKVIDNYEEIQNILYNYEESMKKGKNKKKVNTFEYINLKDTDVKILMVSYHIKSKPTDNIKSGEIDLINYICVPRVVDKFYFKIAGTYYSAMYQITDGSTYNSSTAKNAKCDSVVFRTVFNSSIRIFRSTYKINTIDDQEVQATTFTISIFKKIFNVFEYMIAHFGLYGILDIYRIGKYVSILKESDMPEDDKLYIFKTNNKKIIVTIPKDLFDSQPIIQSLVCVICLKIDKSAKYNEVFSNEYWLKVLGGEFGYGTVEKGESLLCSLEGTYDDITKEGLHLPDNIKKDIYSVLLWVVDEFKNLMIKDNRDLSIKRFQYDSYIASLYTMKLINVMYFLSDAAAKNSLDIEGVLKKMRSLNPYTLVDAMCKQALIPYKHLVNDLDSITALKFTYKNVSNGDKKGKTSVPIIYKNIHPSHLGRLDVDSSTKSDPGLSGILCPLCKTYGDSFSDYDEPVTWDEEFNKVMDEYDKMNGLKQVLVAKQELLNEDKSEDIAVVNCSIDICNKLMEPINEVAKFDNQQLLDSIIPLERGGFIYYER